MTVGCNQEHKNYHRHSFISQKNYLKYIDLLHVQVGNLAAGLCCRVGTRGPGARREEEEVMIMAMMAMMAMVITVMLMDSL